MAPLIYVAGPYRDDAGYTSVDYNIWVARQGCKWLAENGLYFLCPHMNSAHFEAIIPWFPVAHWYEQDIRLLKACDAMLLVGQWTKSQGSLAERSCAEAAGLPIFDYNDDEQCAGLLNWSATF